MGRPKADKISKTASSRARLSMIQRAEVIEMVDQKVSYFPARKLTKFGVVFSSIRFDIRQYAEKKFPDSPMPLLLRGVQTVLDGK